MLGFCCWAIVLIAAGALMCGGAAYVESAWVGGALASVRARILACVACIVVLLIIALLWEAKPIARLDARVIQHLAGSHTSTLTSIMSHLTVTGDTVPSFLIATVLAIVIQRQGIYKVVCWILPLVVLLELVAQLGMWKVFHDNTIGHLHPALVIGGTGKIPSGSVSRLLSIFLVAARLWHTRDPRGANRIATLGIALTAMQLISRLELARHLLADIFAGIVLGLLLALVATLVITYTDVLASRRSGRTERGWLRGGSRTERSSSGRDAQQAG